MNVVVPFTDLAPETRAALVADGIDARYVDVSDDHRSYWRLMLNLWEARETVILVEHDIVISPGTVADFLACPKDWCSRPYLMGAIEGTAFGCTKFSGSLMARQPTAVSRIPYQHRSWHALDSMVTGTLRRNGELEHIHGPAVRHLHWDGGVGPSRETLHRRRNSVATKLLYTGLGRYLNGVPASDFETDDPVLIAQCIETKYDAEGNEYTLYVEDGAPAPGEILPSASSTPGVQPPLPAEPVLNPPGLAADGADKPVADEWASTAWGTGAAPQPTPAAAPADGGGH